MSLNLKSQYGRQRFIAVCMASLLLSSTSFADPTKTYVVPAVENEPDAVTDGPVSQSLSQDHTNFVDDLIAQEQGKKLKGVQDESVDPVNDFKNTDSVLLGASDSTNLFYEESIHFVGMTRVGKRSKAEIFYKGSVNRYSVGSELPLGYTLKKIEPYRIWVTRKEVLQSDSSGQAEVETTHHIATSTFTLTSVIEAKKSKTRFKDDLTFQRSLGLDGY